MTPVTCDHAHYLFVHQGMAKRISGILTAAVISGFFVVKQAQFVGFLQHNRCSNATMKAQHILTHGFCRTDLFLGHFFGWIDTVNRPKSPTDSSSQHNSFSVKAKHGICTLSGRFKPTETKCFIVFVNSFLSVGN